ncbi:hypothetical protein [Belliella pelovolcani]|uniref:hypothetical protein n=1 Tax=Belliella pelovolcani TaxID=529505 RepID=UPI00391929CF
MFKHHFHREGEVGMLKNDSVVPIAIGISDELGCRAAPMTRNEKSQAIAWLFECR